MKYNSIFCAFIALLLTIAGAETWEEHGESSTTVLNFDDGMATTTLSNGRSFPLVGVGLGSSEPAMVVPTLYHGLRDDKKIRLIDTAQLSNNEGLIAAGIMNAADSMGVHNDEKLTVHIVTKIWYTHLGYGRTKLAVKKNLDNFASVLADDRVDLKIHVLLHWPRCYDNIDWMDCEEEENNLDEVTKSAGPTPDAHSWKESWKALEDMYLSHNFPIESIGVSNFQISDLHEFELFARIQPHMLQINMWSLFYDPDVIEYCQMHNIHVQVFNVMGLIKDGSARAPNAHNHLQKIATEISAEGEQVNDLTPAQVINAWLIQHGISVIPRTTNNMNRLNERITENSAVTLTKIPELSDHQVETIAHAMESFLGGQDIQEENMDVMITFQAKSRDLMLYWQRPDGSEVHVAYIPQGSTFNETTLPKHNYKVYDAQNKESFMEYKVQAQFGEHAAISF